MGTLTRINYRGRDALTWFEGYSPWQGGFKGTWVVVDPTYTKIGEVAAQNGYVADGHELEINSQGNRALLDVYNPVTVDLSQYGGSSSATVLEAVVQEIDLVTGAVTVEWHSFDQVPVGDSYMDLRAPAGGGPQVVDYFHPNSLDYDSDGNILVNGRHISATVKLDRAANGGNGDVLWRLGGKHSDFTFQGLDGSNDPSYAPSFPHDARRRPDGTLSVCDNGVLRTPPYGCGIVWQLNEADHTARAVKVWDHGKNLFGAFVGSDRLQPNGAELISYGSTGDATEYDANGVTVWESQFSAGNGQGDQAWSYRTLRSDGWHGTPAEPPAVAVDQSGTAITAYASWNGATDVARWVLLAGPNESALRPIGSSARTGFETALAAVAQPTDTVFVAEAQDAAGHDLGRSTTDQVRQKWLALGGSSSVVGSPVGAEYPVGGGCQAG